MGLFSRKKKDKKQEDVKLEPPKDIKKQEEEILANLKHVTSEDILHLISDKSGIKPSELMKSKEVWKNTWKDGCGNVAKYIKSVKDVAKKNHKDQDIDVDNLEINGKTTTTNYIFGDDEGAKFAKTMETAKEECGSAEEIIDNVAEQAQETGADVKSGDIENNIVVVAKELANGEKKDIPDEKVGNKIEEIVGNNPSEEDEEDKDEEEKSSDDSSDNTSDNTSDDENNKDDNQYGSTENGGEDDSQDTSKGEEGDDNGGNEKKSGNNEGKNGGEDDSQDTSKGEEGDDNGGNEKKSGNNEGKNGNNNEEETPLKEITPGEEIPPEVQKEVEETPEFKKGEQELKKVAEESVPPDQKKMVITDILPTKEFIQSVKEKHGVDVTKFGEFMKMTVTVTHIGFAIAGYIKSDELIKEDDKPKEDPNIRKFVDTFKAKIKKVFKGARIFKYTKTFKNPTEQKPNMVCVFYGINFSQLTPEEQREFENGGVNNGKETPKGEEKPKETPKEEPKGEENKVEDEKITNARDDMKTFTAQCNNRASEISKLKKDIKDLLKDKNYDGIEEKVNQIKSKIEEIKEIKAKAVESFKVLKGTSSEKSANNLITQMENKLKGLSDEAIAKLEQSINDTKGNNNVKGIIGDISKNKKDTDEIVKIAKKDLNSLKTSKSKKSVKIRKAQKIRNDANTSEQIMDDTENKVKEFNELPDERKDDKKKEIVSDKVDAIIDNTAQTDEYAKMAEEIMHGKKSSDDVDKEDKKDKKETKSKTDKKMKKEKEVIKKDSTKKQKTSKKTKKNEELKESMSFMKYYTLTELKKKKEKQRLDEEVLSTIMLVKMAWACKDAVVDAAGSKWIKMKEDKGIIAEMIFYINKQKYSIRFNINDLEWHITKLDDRKAAVDEALIGKVLSSDVGKEFREEVTSRWNKIFKEKGENGTIFNLFLDNVKNGMKVDKKYLETLQRLANGYDTIIKKFNDVKDSSDTSNNDDKKEIESNDEGKDVE